MQSRPGSRISFAISLWRQGLWGRWVAGLYGLAGLFAFIRDEFLMPADGERWALVNLLPQATFNQWLAGAFAILTLWMFEAAYRVAKQLEGTIAGLRPTRSEAEARKYRATRATLSLTLDRTLRYAVDSIRWLKDVREKAGLLEAGHYNHSVSVPTCPRLDGGMIGELREGVEHLDGDVAGHIQGLLSKLQIHQARITELEEYFLSHPSRNSSRVGVTRNVDRFIADSVEIAALVRALFPYARNQQDGPMAPLDIDAVAAAFRECQLNEIQDVDAWNMLTTPYLPKPAKMELG